MSKPFVAIIMGSDSDLPTMQGTIEILKKFGISFEVKISSAHRTPARTHAYVTDAEARGCSIFICAAGLAAHLAGSVAGLTAKPVIGVPMDGGPLNGQDALLSTVQMPGGIPVACVAIGKAGAKNAGYLAAQMLSISDTDLAQRLIDERAENAKIIEEKDNELQKQFS
ncbi:MAG: 5-(carboxyamino)imidazole ribonucleotide mutase [Gammaproteobacteria bacterium]|nr:5-(carboxyamino)imidazole ribonucleotide mutase [Gammaproteobacteria bacterium]